MHLPRKTSSTYSDGVPINFRFHFYSEIIKGGKKNQKNISARTNLYKTMVSKNLYKDRLNAGAWKSRTSNQDHLHSQNLVQQPCFSLHLLVLVFPSLVFPYNDSSTNYYRHKRLQTVKAMRAQTASIFC